MMRGRGEDRGMRSDLRGRWPRLRAGEVMRILDQPLPMPLGPPVTNVVIAQSNDRSRLSSTAAPGRAAAVELAAPPRRVQLPLRPNRSCNHEPQVL